jgi:hypothetical protein
MARLSKKLVHIKRPTGKSYLKRTIRGKLSVPDVYMVDARSANRGEKLSDKIRLLLSVPDFAELIPRARGDLHQG